MLYMGVYQHGVNPADVFFPSVFGFSPVYTQHKNASCFDLITSGQCRRLLAFQTTRKRFPSLYLRRGTEKLLQSYFLAVWLSGYIFIFYFTTHKIKCGKLRIVFSNSHLYLRHILMCRQLSPGYRNNLNRCG